jgi:23S rRNA (pseudouridine1915-N3)-methyltransferase
MLHVTLIACGRLKERYLRDAVEEYSKRLSGYVKLDIREVADGPDMMSEASRIRQCMDDDAYVITLEIEGKELSSTGFADEIQAVMNSGRSHICFIIGSSDGIDESVRKTADMHLSFGRMTYPHQLMRVIFLEQLYRAFRIIRGEPYHK